MTYPSGYYYFINHDNKGRVVSLSQTQGQNNGSDYLNNVSYSIAGQVTGLGLGNGVTESYSYSADRLQLVSQTATKGATSLMNLTYNYSASAGQNGVGSTAGNSGQLMSISGSINSTTESAAYTYDNLGRLVTSNQTTNSVSAQRRFVYDRWGNRTSVYDATSGGNQIQAISLTQSGGVPNNRITSVTNNGGSPANYAYDANGNVTNDGVHSYAYDAENRVVSVDSGTTATYAYDHQNRRVKKTVGSSVTHCVWQGGQVLAEHNGSSGALLINYTYGVGRLLNKTESGTTRYFLSDKLSARVVLDTSGNVVGRQSHLPFGEDLNTSGSTDKHKLTSYERDSETGNDYAVNRGYVSNIGRFNQADPYRASSGADNPKSWNRYAYVQNNPVGLIDPSGLLMEEPESRLRYWDCWITTGLTQDYVAGEFTGYWSPGITSIGCNPPTNLADSRSSGVEEKKEYCQITIKFKVVTTSSSSSGAIEYGRVFYHAYVLTQTVDENGMPLQTHPNFYRGGHQVKIQWIPI
ncbi:MAG: RHS repeat-associated core domain-containing protein [Acidobacteriota bacterium]